MGGANSIVNVFDINNYHQEQLNAMKGQKERAGSFDTVTAEDAQPEGQAAMRGGKFGAEMIV